MFVNLRLWVRKILRHLGYDLHSLPVDSLTLRDLEFDLRYLVKGANPIVLDVGANAGQSIELFRRTLNKPRIFSFEPNPTLAEELKKKYADCDIVVETAAVGSSEGTSVFNIMEKSDLSSILQLQQNRENPFSDNAVIEIIKVLVTTVDSYAKMHRFTHIDLLKIDTQGFDLEVLYGAVEILRRRAVDVLLVEVNLVPLYKGQGSFGDIQRFLAEEGYGLLTLYEVNRSNSCVRWATACFRPVRR